MEKEKQYTKEYLDFLQFTVCYNKKDEKEQEECYNKLINKELTLKNIRKDAEKRTKTI